MEFILLGQCKSGKNSILITRTGHRYPNEQWAAWRDAMLLSIRLQMPKPIQTISQPCSVVVRYTPGDRRRRDVPGLMDALWHCLERAQVVDDDKWLENVTWVTTGIDRANPCVKLRIEKKVERVWPANDPE